MRENILNRRQFVTSAAAGVAGILLSAPLSAEQSQEDAKQRPSREFICRALGDTGIRLPVVSLGVMNSDNPNLVRAALEAGVILVDTAWWYMDGRNEEMIGQVLKGRPRDSFVVATKVPGSVPLPYATGCFPDDEVSREMLVPAFVRRFETSLKRLGLEYVDILYLHNIWTREAALFEPLLATLSRLRQEGKTCHVGLSTHRNEPQVIQAAIDSGLYDVILTSYNFRQDHREQVGQAIAQAAQSGLGVVAMKVMAGGYLDEEKTRPVNPTAALKWVLQNENVHTAILGCTTFDQLDLDLSIMKDLTLDEAEKKDLQLESAIEGSPGGGLYCQGCGHCQDQCPRKLPIPDLMRAYMYARGYGNHRQSRELVLSLNLPGDICQSCDRCHVVCRQGFDVKQRVRDILGLQDLSGRLFV